MKITKAHATNFLSYANLDYGYTKQGLTLVEGPVGVGKSAFLDVVSYGLFGKISKDVAADEVINRKAGRDLLVEIEFEDAGSQCKIMRSRHHSVYGSDLVLTVDGKDIRGKDVRETQKLIEQRIGFSFDTFNKSTYFSQFSPIDRFLSATDAEKKRLISEICDLSYYDSLLEKIKIDVSTKQKWIAEMDTTMKVALGKQELILKKQNETREKMLSWESKHNQNLRDAQNQLSAFETMKQQRLAQANSMVAKRQKELDEAQAALTTALAVEWKDLSAEKLEVQQKLDMIRQLETKKAEISADKCHRTLMVNDRLQRINKEQLKLNHKEGSTCPHCYGPMSHVHIQKSIDLLKSENVADNVAIEQLLTSIAAIDQGISVKADLLGKQQQFAKQDADQRTHTENLKWYQKKVDDIKAEMVRDSQRLETEQAAVNPYVKMVEMLQAEQNPHKMADVAQEIAAIKLELSNIDGKIKSLQSGYQIAVWWKDALSIYIRSYLMDSFLEQINQKANEYLNTLFEGSLQLNITATTERGSEVKEKIDVTIFNNGEECSYESLSGGERCRICLAANLALSDLTSQMSSKTFNLLMLDEIFTGLDEDGKTQTLKLLKDLEGRFDSIFVIDHTEGFKSAFSNVLTINKVDGLSCVSGSVV